MKLRKLTRDDVQIELSCERETETIYGNASAIDPETDRAIEQEIVAQLRAGNEWAWCTVRVRVTWGAIGSPGDDIVGTAHLGCCSYASEAQFREPGGYFDDLVNEALDELNEKIANTFETIKTLVEV